MTSNTEQRELLDDTIWTTLEAIRATAIVASGSCKEPGIEGTFLALQILADRALEGVSRLDMELKK